MMSERPVIERSASSAARALFRRSASVGKRPQGTHPHSVIRRVASQLETVQSQANNHLSNTPNHVSNAPSHVTSLTNENESDEGESTAEEIAQSVESSNTNTDNILDPIDFIENNPRLADPGNMEHSVGKTQYENWGMFTERELEELTRKSKSNTRIPSVQLHVEIDITLEGEEND